MLLASEDIKQKQNERSVTCEPVWPSGKGVRLVSRGTSVRIRLALLSFQKLWSVDTVLTSSLTINETLNGSHRCPSVNAGVILIIGI